MRGRGGGKRTFLGMISVGPGDNVPTGMAVSSSGPWLCLGMWSTCLYPMAGTVGGSPVLIWAHLAVVPGAVGVKSDRSAQILNSVSGVPGSGCSDIPMMDTLCLSCLEAPVPTWPCCSQVTGSAFCHGPLPVPRPAPLWTCKHGNLGHPTCCLPQYSDLILWAPLAPQSPGRSGFLVWASQSTQTRGARGNPGPEPPPTCLPRLGGT